MIQFRQRCFTFMFPFLYFVDTLSHFLRKAHTKLRQQAHFRMEMSRNVQSGNTQNLKSPFVNQAACCACTHSRYFAGGSPNGLRV